MLLTNYSLLETMMEFFTSISLLVFCGLLASEILYQLGEVRRHWHAPVIGCVWCVVVLFLSPTGTGPDFFLDLMKCVFLGAANLALSLHQLRALGDEAQKERESGAKR
ncbi:MAG: hypothetical protein K2W95_29740 [Candidatus Obscuribacterales bacterium]|nr:hypothetical protein [Candidatus Obscuribacterales bacterium]